jgi:hypothetical protein
MNDNVNDDEEDDDEEIDYEDDAQRWRRTDTGNRRNVFVHQTR